MSEHSQRPPAGLLYVPVRSGGEWNSLRIFRTPVGVRTAVAFTSKGQLTNVLGSDQHWIRLAHSGLRSIAAQLGVTALTVDPQLSAPAPGSWQRRFGRGARRHAGTAAVAGVHQKYAGR